MAIVIKTNDHSRYFTYRCDVPEKVLKSDFDYQDPEDAIDGFFCYGGIWYHLDQFMRIDHSPDSEFSKWDGCAGDSYWSGTLIKVSDDRETYKIGRYYQVG